MVWKRAGLHGWEQIVTFHSACSLPLVLQGQWGVQAGFTRAVCSCASVNLWRYSALKRHKEHQRVCVWKSFRAAGHFWREGPELEPGSQKARFSACDVVCYLRRHGPAIGATAIGSHHPHLLLRSGVLSRAHGERQGSEMDRINSPGRAKHGFGAVDAIVPNLLR